MVIAPCRWARYLPPESYIAHLQTNKSKKAFLTPHAQGFYLSPCRNVRPIERPACLAMPLSLPYGTRSSPGRPLLTPREMSRSTNLARSILDWLHSNCPVLLAAALSNQLEPYSAR